MTQLKPGMKLIIPTEVGQAKNPSTVARVKRYLCVGVALVLTDENNAATCRDYSSLEGSLESRNLAADGSLRHLVCCWSNFA